ncbi:MAG TPA: hypothetical protein VGO62_00865, partial [Myxococcota bacterium]
MCVLALSASASCSGCSAQCQGVAAGSENCGCQSDQDCTTKNGLVLLCIDGTCTRGDPDDVPGSACGGSSGAGTGTCPAGQSCGIDNICLPAPRCERVDEAAAPLSFRTSNGDSGTVTASRDDCTHHWQAGPFNGDVAIALDGTITATPGGGSCTGTWSASDRL